MREQEQNKETKSEKICSFVPVFHSHVPEDQLILKWKLTADEFEFIAKNSIKKHFTWYSYCFLFVKENCKYPSATERIPYSARAFLNEQFSLPKETKIFIPNRESTRVHCRSCILGKLSLECFDDQVVTDLRDWILSQALSGVGANKIREQVPAQLKLWRVLIPSDGSLQRVLQSAIENADTEIYKLISNSLSAEIKTILESLLEVSDETKTSALFALKDVPKNIQPATILDALEKAFLIEEYDFKNINLNFISSNAISFLANRALQYDAYDFKRFELNKRYSLMLCLVINSGEKILDNIVQMHSAYVTHFERKSRNVADKKLLKLRRRSKGALKLLISTSTLVFQFKGKALNDAIEKEIDKIQLGKAIADTEALHSLEDRGFLDELLARHSHLKRYLSLFMTLPFEAEKNSAHVLNAIEAYLKNVSDKFEIGSLKDFEWVVRPSLRDSFHKSSPNDQKKVWEICLAFEVKDKLKTLELFLPQSRYHKSFWTMVEGAGAWKKRQEEAYKKLEVPKSFKDFSSVLKNDFDSAFEGFSKGLPKNKFVELNQDGSLQFRKETKTEQPQGLKELSEAMRVLLPKHVPIEDVLWEVEALTSFAAKLCPSQPSKRTHRDEKAYIFAAVLAHGTNIGLAGMANATRDVSIDALLETTRSRLTAENLATANEAIVKYHLQMPFSKNFESQSIASSDGQRFRVQEDSIHTDLCVRYFGHFRKAMNVVSHVTNSGAVFATQAILCGVREAFAMVNGLCKAGPDFYPSMHTTDSHGYTDAMFLILSLLGIQFAPRLKDLGDVRLFAHEDFSSHAKAAAVFEKAQITLAECAPYWDDMVRIVSALQSGQVSAFAILPKIVACQSGDGLSLAFRKLGQILKSTFLLKYFHDPDLRQTIRRQLNRGELRHALARQVFFSNKGEFRPGDLDSLISKASCLSLVCNAILVWNTVHYERAVEELEAGGHIFDRNLFKHISPLSWEHIRISGRYDFRSKSQSNEGKP